MSYQFMVFNDEAIKPLLATVILEGFKKMAMICAIAFIPALFSAILIRRHKSHVEFDKCDLCCLDVG